MKSLAYEPLHYLTHSLLIYEVDVHMNMLGVFSADVLINDIKKN